MLIPLIPKDPKRNDFTCQDGEIAFVFATVDSALKSSPTAPYGAAVGTTALHGLTIGMTALHDYPTVNIRIPLQSGDKQKAELMLTGEISRVDPETAERLTQAIVQRAAEALLDISTDLRRQGLFILPFRVYTMLQLADGTLSYPTPQAVALPTDYPPHPEITAASVTDNALTLALRFPVMPHRLTAAPTTDLHAEGLLRTFISYPLYIPDPKEMRGSIGSVRSAAGGNATGIRFAFLSTSALKASVAAPEKYYELIGNERTGYRVSSKAAAAPDYSCYATASGVAPFPRASLLAIGDGVAADTDPLDWIADWVKADCSSGSSSNLSDYSDFSEHSEHSDNGYLPIFLPHKYWHSDGSESSESSDKSELSDWSDVEVRLAGIEGIDADFVRSVAETLGTPCVLLTRPMTFATDSVSRRHATPTAIRTLSVLGLPPGEPAHAVLYGSDDGVRWTPLRRFDPRVRTSVLTPPRLFWRLLLWSSGRPDRHAVGVTCWRSAGR